jgi:predicted NBD/HSP70 family sugar kinase
MNDIRPIRAKSGTNQEGTSAHNRRVMLDALRLNGALSRADLARATKLTKQTVSNIIEELEGDGLVISLAAVRKGRGQPSTPYRLVPEGAFAIGLQIDRHVTRAVAVDLVGTALVRAEAKLPAEGPVRGVKVVLDLIEGIRRRLAEISVHSEERLVGLGVAMPGPFGLDASDDNPWMMAAWQNFPLLETLAAGTGLDVARQNDAAACATAERMVGAAHGVDHAVCLYLGYGIGAGLILNGELYNGANGNAGEIGMILSPPGSAGWRGQALEHRAALSSLYQHMGYDPGDPLLHEKIVTAVEISDAALDRWLTAAAADLRWSVQIVETTFDPETIILCGSAPEPLARRLLEEMHPLLPSIAERRQRKLPRLQLGMTDPWAVAQGAAAEPISRTFDPRFSAILKTRSGSAY